MASPTRRVLIAGGGFAALEALAALQSLTHDGLDVMVLAPERDLVYRPTSVLSPFTGKGGERFALSRTVADLGGTLHVGALDEVDLDAHRVITQDRVVLEYDELVVAIGATARPSVRGAVTFRGTADAPAVRRAVDDLAARRVAAMALVVPPGVAWSLPMVELALLAADCAGPGRVELVTAERAGLELFGPAVSEAVEAILTDAGVRLHKDRAATSFDGERLWVGLGAALPCGLVVAAAQLAGPAVAGLPHDNKGFLPVDGFGRIRGTDVFAAGDGTDVPYKQGGVAAQLADVIAQGIAHRAGAGDAPAPLRPVLRAMLATPTGPLFLRRDTTEPDGEISREAIWWPPAKVAAPHLAGYLATRHGELAGLR